MKHYFFRSAYRLPILALVVTIIGLWVVWYRTFELISPTLLVYCTGIILLNIMLGFFAYDRQTTITRFLFFFSYGIIVLVGYALIAAIRGIS